MSKLFHDMQNAGSYINQSREGAVLTSLLEVPPPAAPASRGTPLLRACRSVTLPEFSNPILAVEDEPKSHAAFEAYRALRTKLTRFQAAQGIRSIAITSAVPGEGKTVSALNLALCFAQLETPRVLLVDADLRSAGLSKRTGNLESPGLAEVLAGNASFESAIVATNIPSLFLAGSGELTSAASDLFAGAIWKEFVEWTNQSFTIVIVDCPPVLGLADFDLIGAGCDGMLLVVRALRTKRERLTATEKQLQGKKLLGVVMNGQERQHKNYYGYHYYSR